MSELHKFLFDGLPVRGMLVRLTDSWQEILRRREANSQTGAYPAPLRALLGEMAAAGVLMQSNIKFNGALVLQIFGEGPVKVAVVEVQPDLSLRATASVVGEISPDMRLSQMVNVAQLGRCAITLDPQDRFPGQQPYQGVVPLVDDHGQSIEQVNEVLQHYMLQSEQLDTRLVLAANDQVAAGLLIQRLPLEGEGNLDGQARAAADAGEPSAREALIGLDEHYNRISLLAASLKREELLTLDVDTILRRLFWEEQITRYEPLQPRFACRCSRDRVAGMIRSLGTAEVEDILAERGEIEVACDFCGQQYSFDAVDAARLFLQDGQQPPVSSGMQ